MIHICGNSYDKLSVMISLPIFWKEEDVVLDMLAQCEAEGRQTNN